MEDAHQAELHEHYARGEERGRLAEGHGRLEFARTTEIILRRLPAAPALVADIGGGPGRYALWLAGLGYRVEHRDLVPLHVRQLREDADGIAGLRTAVSDARDLDLADASVDAVLLLGPLYHLRRRAERVRALGEARRVVQPAGPVSWSAWKGRLSCWLTWPNGWTTRPRGPWSWTAPGPWSGYPNCSASARTCWPPASAPGEAGQ